jgi:DNA-binding MarR family transcriptional regulator
MADEQPLEHDDTHRLGHLLWEVGAHTSLLGEATLAVTALTPASAGILDVIAAYPGISIAEMARRLPTSAQGISQIVARLEKLGYVERRLGATGRGVALTITEAGERARREASERLSASEEELAEALGRDDYDRLIELLRRARPIVVALDARRRRKA